MSETRESRDGGGAPGAHGVPGGPEKPGIPETPRVLDALGEPDLFVPEAAANLLDAIAGIERTIASLMGMRARMIDHTHDWLLANQRSRVISRGAAADRRLARDVLVAELAPLLRIPGNSAARLVAESRTLVADLPDTLAALGEGAIAYRHAQVVVENAETLSPECRHDYEAAVLPAATRLNTSRFRERARRMRERLHPDSLRVRRATQFERRGVTLEPARDGMAWLSAYLPAEAAIAIDDRLDRLAASLRSPDDERTFAQLRADAFCELLTTGEAEGVTRGIRAQVLVTVPVLTLLGLDDEPGSLEGYGPIPADVARQLAADAPSFVRLLTHPETGAVLSVGRDRYSIPADMRLYLRARDETCRGVGCGRRAGTCDVDHGRGWAEGGETAVGNLAHLCRGDHGRKTRLGWHLEHLPGGTLRWTSPLGRTYLTEPSTVIRA